MSADTSPVVPAGDHSSSALVDTGASSLPHLHEQQSARPISSTETTSHQQWGIADQKEMKSDEVEMTSDSEAKEPLDLRCSNRLHQESITCSVLTDTAHSPLTHSKLDGGEVSVVNAAARRTYSQHDLQAALAELSAGRLGTRRAAARYGVPRSTLRNKLYRQQQQQQQQNKECEVLAPDSTRSQCCSPVPADLMTGSSQWVSAYWDMQDKSVEQTEPDLTSKQWRLQCADGTSRLSALCHEMARRLSSARLIQLLEESRAMGREQSSLWRPNPTLSSESPPPANSCVLPPLIPLTLPHSALCSLHQSGHNNTHTDNFLKSDALRLSGRPNSIEPLCDNETLEGKSQSSSAVVDVVPMTNKTPKIAAGKDTDSTTGKAPRPKRGKYRNYNRDSLEQAVRAVQRGQMSVHRAGNHYGVPHSTLEYKVKQRHLDVTAINPNIVNGSVMQTSLSTTLGDNVLRQPVLARESSGKSTETSGSSYYVNYETHPSVCQPAQWRYQSQGPQLPH